MLAFLWLLGFFFIWRGYVGLNESSQEKYNEDEFSRAINKLVLGLFIITAAFLVTLGNLI